MTEAEFYGDSSIFCLGLGSPPFSPSFQLLQPDNEILKCLNSQRLDDGAVYIFEDETGIKMQKEPPCASAVQNCIYVPTKQHQVEKDKVSWLFDTASPFLSIAEDEMKPEVLDRKYLRLQSFLFSRVVVLLYDEEGLMTRFESMVECDGMVELPHKLSTKHDGLVFFCNGLVARFSIDDEPEEEEAVGGNVELQEDSSYWSPHLLLELANSGVAPATAQQTPEIFYQIMHGVSTHTNADPAQPQQSAPAASTAALPSAEVATTTSGTPSSKVRSQRQILTDLMACYRSWAASSIKLSNIKKYVGSSTDPSVPDSELHLPFARHSTHCKNSKVCCTDDQLEIHIYPYTMDPVTRAYNWLTEYDLKEVVKRKDALPWKSIGVIYTAWNMKYCGWNTPALFFLVCFAVGGTIQLSITLCIYTGKMLNKKPGALLYEQRHSMDNIFADIPLRSPTKTLSAVVSSLPPPGSNRKKRGVNAQKRTNNQAEMDHQGPTQPSPKKQRQITSSGTPAAVAPVLSTSHPSPSSTIATAVQQTAKTIYFVVFKDEAGEIILERKECPCPPPSVEFSSLPLKMTLSPVMWIFTKPFRLLPVQQQQDGLYYITLQGQQPGTTYALVIHSGDDNLWLFQNKALKNSKMLLPSNISSPFRGGLFQEDEAGTSGILIAYFGKQEEEAQKPRFMPTSSPSASREGGGGGSRGGQPPQGFSGSSSSSSSSSSVPGSTGSSSQQRGNIENLDQLIVIAYLNGECVGKDGKLQPSMLKEAYPEELRGVDRSVIWQHIHNKLKLYDGGAHSAIATIDQSVIIEQLVRSCFVVRDLKKVVSMLSKCPQVMTFQYSTGRNCEEVLNSLLQRYTSDDKDDASEEMVNSDDEEETYDEVDESSLSYYQYLQLLLLMAKTKCNSQTLSGATFIDTFVQAVKERSENPIVPQLEGNTLMMKLRSFVPTPLEHYGKVKAEAQKKRNMVEFVVKYKGFTFTVNATEPNMTVQQLEVLVSQRTKLPIDNFMLILKNPDEILQRERTITSYNIEAGSLIEVVQTQKDGIRRVL